MRIPLADSPVTVDVDLRAAAVTGCKQSNPYIRKHRPEAGEPYDEITLRLLPGAVVFTVDKE